MRSGCSPEPTVKTGSSQCPETTRIAFGRSGRPLTRPFSQAAVLSQGSAGPGVHSMKKQGPAPCGMKRGGKVIGRLLRVPLDPVGEGLGEAGEELAGGLVDQLAVLVEQGGDVADVGLR